MKLVDVLFAFCALCACSLFSVYIYVLTGKPNHGELINVVDSQNQTIHQLMRLVDSSLVKSPLDLAAIPVASTNGQQHLKDVGQYEKEIAQLKKSVQDQNVALQSLKSRHAIEIQSVKKEFLSGGLPMVNNPVPVPERALVSQSPGFITSPPLPKIQQECEARYGVSLINSWRNNKEEWCAPDNGSPVPSSIHCYPYHQQHKKLDGRQADLFCEATNLFIDFSKLHGDVVKPGESKNGKPRKGQEYLSYDRGSLFGSCKKTPKYNSKLFMNHHAGQMRSFTDQQRPPADYKTVEETTYLLARDEDCENSFHATADFMNMYLVMSVLGLSPSECQVSLWDRFADGPYAELIKKAFSPSHPLTRPTTYRNGVVMFKRLVFHLESPAGLIFPKVSRPDPLRCWSTGLFQAYRSHILHSFQLYQVDPPAIPTVTVILRTRSDKKNVGRVLANQAAVESVLQSGTMIKYQLVDPSKMSFAEQLKMVRSTNILVGVHGAGLMHIMFAAEEAVLVEVHPSYRQDRHFRHAARMTGKQYMPLRATSRETCVGTSDNVVVPVEQFRATMDGAVRLARSFDDGLSECGLVCDSALLAIDSRLDPFYKDTKTKKSAPMNTRFPC